MRGQKPERQGAGSSCSPAGRDNKELAAAGVGFVAFALATRSNNPSFGGTSTHGFFVLFEKRLDPDSAPASRNRPGCAARSPCCRRVRFASLQTRVACRAQQIGTGASCSGPGRHETFGLGSPSRFRWRTIRWRWTFRSVLAQPNCWTPWTRSPTHTVGACIWRRTRSAGRRDCAWDILAFRHYGTAPCRPSVTAAANAQARLRLHPRPTKANSHATRGGLPFRSADCRNYCRWRARHDRTKIARWRPTQGRLPRTARLRRPARPCYGS